MYFKVKFPGAYGNNDPGLNIDIYTQAAATQTTYVIPGPPLYGSASTGTTVSPGSTTTVRTTTTAQTTTVAQPTQTAVGTVGQYGQCGGQGKKLRTPIYLNADTFDH